MGTVRLFTLGSARWEADDSRSGSFSLPALVVLKLRLARSAITKDEAICLLWPNTAETKARHNLRQVMLKIRQEFPEVDLRTDGNCLTLSREIVEVDCIQAGSFARGGRLVKALQLHRGIFLNRMRLRSNGLEHWADRVRASQRMDVRQWLLDLLLTHPERILELEESLPCLRSILHRDPLLTAASAALAFHSGDVSRTKWTLARMPSNAPAELRPIIKELRDRIRTVRRVSDRMVDRLPFVGRARELAVLQGVWAQAEGGQVQRIEVIGALGVGKTRLVRQVARWAAIRGGRVISLRCSATGPSLAQSICSEVARKVIPSDPGRSIRLAWDRRETLAVESVVELCSQTPALVLLDDFQQANDEAHRLLESLPATASSGKLMIVLVRRAVGSQPPKHASRAVYVDDLTPTDARSLAEGYLGARESEELVESVMRKARGNPLLIREYCRIATHANSLSEAKALIASERASDAIRTALRGHGRTAIQILEILSVARVPLGLSALRIAIGMGAGALRARLSRLMEEGIVTWDDDGIALAHEYYRTGLAAVIPTPEVRHYHRVLARALIGRGAKHSREIAHHLEEAGEDRLAFSHYLRAGMYATRHASRETALDLLRKASDLAERTGQDPLRLKVAMADFRYLWEDYGLATSLYREVLRDTDSLSRRQALRCRIRYVRSGAAVGTHRGEYATLKSLLPSTRRLKDAELELEGAYAVFSTLSDTAERTQYRSLANEFWRIAQRWPDDIVAARALCQAALLYLGGAKGELALKTADEALARSTRVADPGTSFESYTVRATVRTSQGNLILAGQDISKARELLSGLRRIPRRQLWYVNSGVYLLERGSWKEAEQALIGLFEENACSGAPALNVVVAVNLAILCFEQQRYGDSMKYARIARELDAHAGNSAPAVAVEGLILLEANDVKQAKRRSDALASGRPYFGDHSYAALLSGRLLAREAGLQASQEYLLNESRRWSRVYYPGSARLRLECYSVAPTDSSDIEDFASGCHSWGLSPIAAKARKLIETSTQPTPSPLSAAMHPRSIPIRRTP